MACNKVPYETNKAALDDIKIIRAHNLRYNKKATNAKSGRKYRTYNCRYCGKYHLTTARRRKKRKSK